MAEKFDALIIDADIASRMRLKQVTSSVHHFGKVYQLNTFCEGLERMAGNEPCNVIFISYQLDPLELKNFIQEGKKTTQGADAAYVLVMKAKDQDSTSVASNVLVGADGLLFEPYSVDNLVEITRLAAKVKGERSKAREFGAIKFLVADVMNQLDQIAFNKASGAEVGPSVKKLREAAEVLKTFSGDQIPMYYDVAVQSFIDAPTPKRNFQRIKYVGASKRMLKKATDKGAKPEAPKAEANGAAPEGAAAAAPGAETPKPPQS